MEADTQKVAKATKGAQANGGGKNCKWELSTFRKASKEEKEKAITTAEKKTRKLDWLFMGKCVWRKKTENPGESVTKADKKRKREKKLTHTLQSYKAPEHTFSLPFFSQRLKAATPATTEVWRQIYLLVQQQQRASKQREQRSE